MTLLDGSMRCPACSRRMEEGFMSTGGGLNWFRRFDSTGYDFAQGIPGTHTTMRLNRVEAWRCRPCEMILFRYGEKAAQELAARAERESPYSSPETPPSSGATSSSPTNRHDQD